MEIQYNIYDTFINDNTTQQIPYYCPFFTCAVMSVPVVSGHVKDTPTNLGVYVLSTHNSQLT